jgi:hypothetical protein
MASHTPAPWRFEQSTMTIRGVPGNHWLASMDSFDGHPNHEANAKLIACAPELLAVAEAVLETLQRKAVVGHFAESIAALQGVIAKARA